MAAVAENAQLYEEVERRARAARALETIADGVVLLDSDERVLLWNNAAQAITGIAGSRHPRPAGSRGAARVRRQRRAVDVDGRPQTVPVEIDGKELWLSFSAVRFEEGTVYAFRDLTEERGLEQMRSDFVATVSHELRTPLAAIYGAAITLRRADLDLGDEMRARLLDVVAEESDRLAQIVNDVLLASHLDSGQLQLDIQTIDAAAPDRERRRVGAGSPAGDREPRRCRSSSGCRRSRPTSSSCARCSSTSSRTPSSTRRRAAL